MAESTTGWFSVREKYYLLTDKLRFISQIQTAEPAVDHWMDMSTHLLITHRLNNWLREKKTSLPLLLSFDYTLQNRQQTARGYGCRQRRYAAVSRAVRLRSPVSSSCSLWHLGFCSCSRARRRLDGYKGSGQAVEVNHSSDKDHTEETYTF